MTDPVTLTASTLVAIAASKFVEAAAKKAGDVVAPSALKAAGAPIEALWSRIKEHFAGNKRAKAAIAQIETEQSEAALNKLEVYLDDELSDPEQQSFAKELRQMTQQIINIGEQTQTNEQVTLNVDAKDNARVTAVGKLDATTVNFGDVKA